MDRSSWHCTGGSNQDHLEEKEMQKRQNGCLRGLTNSCEMKRNKSKGGKERYSLLNAEFQRIERRDKKAFLSFRACILLIYYLSYCWTDVFVCLMWVVFPIPLSGNKVYKCKSILLWFSTFARLGFTNQGVNFDSRLVSKGVFPPPLREED